MSRVGWLLLVLAVAAGGAVAAVPRPPAEIVAGAALDFLPTEDPFPIRRVRGTDPRLPELLKELEPGPVTRLPRAEFESRVRAAGRAVLGAKHMARVADATYSAELDGGELTGTAELGILNADGVTGYVPLDPLRLAVRGAKWADGPVILAVPAGGASPAVWVDRDGRRVLQLTWSLTGTTEPGERRFEMRVPPCATSSLELNLPADQVPTASADVLLTGPFEAPGKPARRLWRLRFGGRAKAEFAVRTAGAADGIAVAKLVAKYDLAAGQLTAAFEYDLHPARGSAGEWTFTADPALRITDVVTNNRAGWTVDPPALPGGPRRVRVTLRQPGPGGKVQITAVAPFPDPARPEAPLPAVRPLNAVLDDEKVEIRVPPGLKVESWASGDYRLTDAAPAPTGAAEQSRVLPLTGTLLPPGTDEAFRRMPVVRTAPAEAEFTTYERLEWEPDPARSVLAARVTVRVRRGPLFQVTVRPPPGFTLDRGASGPDEFVSHVGSLTASGYVVEFARPLAAGQQAELRLEFRAPGVKLGEAVPFPAFAVAGVAERDGWFSIDASPQWALAVRPGAGAAPGGLWGWLTTESPADARAVYLFRGKEPDGTATLTAAHPTVTADAVVRVDVIAERWVATTRLTFNVTGSVLPSAAVFVPGGHTERTWKLLDETNSITDATPVSRELLELIPLLSPFDTRAAIAGSLAREGSAGTVWVLRFARPLAGADVLETTAPGPPTGEVGAVLPVPRLLGTTQATRAEAGAIHQGLAELTLSGDFVRPRLRLASAHGMTPGEVSDAYLVTAVRAPGEAVAAFGGTVRDTRGGSLGLFLPAGAEVRGVCVAGRWLNPAACAERDADGAIRVPVPAGKAVRFEVRYRLPVAAGWPTRVVSSPVPEVIGGTPPVKQWWAFAAGMLPGWPARPWDATADEPPLLGGPLTGGEPLTLVTRSDDQWVRVGAAQTADALAVAFSAGLLVFGLVAARRRRVWGAAILAGFVVVNLLIIELGPPWWARTAWPPVCAATAALALVLVTLTRRTRAAAPAVAAASLTLFLLHSLAAVAQPGTPATVLIVPGADGGEDVIAARAVLDRLDALAKPPLPVAVITAAAYDLRADETGARITAKFVVHAFRPGDNTVLFPLGDARLERAAVDGTPAFPTSPRPDTYAVTVAGPGRHEIELRFAASVTATGPEREIRFGMPEVPEAKLAASLPGAARQPVAVGRVGRQIATTGDRATVEADLGATKAVHLRWREGGGGAAVAKVREAAIWDVTDTGATLTAAYLVRVEQGTLNGLRLDVPVELEVLRVAARTTDAPVGPLALRDWTLAAEKTGGRLLRVDFQAPVAGRFVVVVECAPRKPLTRQPVLRFPRVVFGTVTGETEAVYGLRATRATIEGVGLGGVIDFPADALKDFTVVPDLKLDSPVRAFRPAPGVAAELRPLLHVGEPTTVRTATAWHVGPQRADAAGTISWQAKEPLPLLEFTIGGVKVLELRGGDVVAWNQVGGRVQVWLRPGVREAAVEWIGTVTPAQGKPPAPLSFDAVHPIVSRAVAASDDVRVKPTDGWSAKAVGIRGWQAVPAAPGEVRFHTDIPPTQPPRVHLIPGR